MRRRKRRSAWNTDSLSSRRPLGFRRPLRIEPLEERRMLAVITVTTNSDVIDFNDGVVSLREAVFVANTAPGADSIEFDFGHDGPETIVLTQGELVITDSLTITGAGAGLLTIDASGSDPTPDVNNGDGSRVFLIDDGVIANRFTAEIRGLTLTGGDSDDLRGGGIHSREHLTLRECVISGNAIRNAIGGEGTAGWGGGIQSLYGNLTIIDSTLAGNSATVAGGAIDFNRVSFDVSLSIVNSTIVENAGGAQGGGILIAGDATITDTLIHDNFAGNGGGIAVWSNATDANVSIENSQITNNRATAGGGIYSNSNAATFLIVGSAITGNEAVSIGGGILMRRSGPLAANAYSLEVRSSTISGNLAAGGVGLFATDPTDGTGTAIKIESSRIAENKLHVPSSNGPAGGIDTPRIARLVIMDSVVEANDGVGIGARGVGQPFGVLTLERTQVRGNGRAGVRARDLRVTLTESTVAGNGDDGVVHNTGSLNVMGGSFSDNHGSGIYSHTGDVNITGATITGNTSSQAGGGVYSFQGALTVALSTISGNSAAIGGGGIHHGSNTTHALRITESTISDNAGRRGGGVYSSQYVYVADSIISKNQATFQGGGIDALNRVVLLRSAVTDNLTIGPNRSGGGISAVGAADLVLIQDSSVSNNSATGSGGGIQTNATVRVTRSSILGNTAFAHGGGIHAPGRTITVTDSTVARNRTTGPNAQGGGIVGGAITVTQSTVSGNRTEGSISPGGGIVASQLTLNQSTVVDNHALAADAMSGGIQVTGATQLNGSIIADNSAGGGNPDIRTGSFVAPNYSLVGSTSGLTAVQLNVLNAGVGNLLNSDPKLGPLAFNGGPTFLDGTKMLTHALLAGSPAIDAGNPTITRPVAEYRFEEEAGAMIAEDFFGTNDGTYHGSPLLGEAGVPFAGGTAATFDGVDDFVTIPPSVAGDFSFSLWVKTTQSFSGGVWLLRQNPGIDGIGFGILLFNGRPQLIVGGSSISTNVAINNGNWHHLAVVRNGTTGARAMFLDGIRLDGAEAPSGPIGVLGTSEDIYVGLSPNGNVRFAGTMDELAVYDRVLSSAEVAQLAAAGGLFDQRGEPHLRVLDGDEQDDIAIDIGPYERQFGETYNFVVDTLVDESDGDYSLGDFSLREAIELANANPGADVIEFAPELTVGGPATILLTQGELEITDALTINGPGAGLLTIDASGNDPTPDSTLIDGDNTNDGDGSRVFNVDDATSAAIDVVIRELSLTGGDAGGDGGAVNSKENLTIGESVVRDNVAKHGGGIQSSIGLLKLERSTVRGNAAFFDGGGIVGLNGDVFVADSTISGNTTNENGGGIEAYICDLTVTGSTISGNSANLNGGGIDVVAGTLQASHTTIVENLVDADLNMVGHSGGIASDMSDGVHLSHVIVANNRRGNNFGNDINVAVQADYSLIRTAIGVGLVGVGNITGADPRLGPLGFNGGPTATHALLPGSPAIDAGSPVAVAGMDGVPEFDGRGTPWTRIAGGQIDIGAVERQANPLPGDYNFNGVVDAADYVVWRNTLGSMNDLQADGSGAIAGVPDGVVDQLDYAFWKSNFGNVLATGGGAGAAEVVESSRSVLAQRSPALPGVDAGLGVGSLQFDVAQLGIASLDHTNTAGKPLAEPGAARLVSDVAAIRDSALLAWFARRAGNEGLDPSDEAVEHGVEAVAESAVGTLDEVFATLDRGF